jgi:uncharacterized membrane protein YqgA involved in biofilm formation
VIHLTGTFINAGTVLAGTVAGALLGERLPGRLRETVMDGLGLVTLLVGMDGALAATRPPLTGLVDGAASGGVPILIVLGSVLVGGIVGELILLDDRLTTMGDALKRRFGRGQSRFTEGFVVASLVFCVGPLTILGSIRDGLSGDYSLLAIKAMLDGFAALAFASALGWGVGFSIITILLYQGGLSLAASAVAGAVGDPSASPAIAAVTATGGVLILAIGLRLLRVREIRVANLLPALLLAPLAVVVVERVT